MSLRRQLDQRLTALYAVENQQERVETKSETVEEQKSLQEAIPDAEEVTQESDVTKKDKVPNEKDKDFLDKLDHLILTNLLQTDLDVNFLAQCKLLCFF